jgi:hypothetical protein
MASAPDPILKLIDRTHARKPWLSRLDLLDDLISIAELMSDIHGERSELLARLEQERANEIVRSYDYEGSR